MKEEQASRRAKSSVIGPGCSGKGVFLFFSPSRVFFSFSLLPARFFFFFSFIYIIILLFFPFLSLAPRRKVRALADSGGTGQCVSVGIDGDTAHCRYEWIGRGGEEEGKGGRKGKADVMGTEGSYRIV